MTGPTLNFELQNQTTSGTVYAYITGSAIDNGNKVFLLQADGQTPYYPDSPSSTLQPLQVNCAISLGAPGASRTVTIPHLAGARLWFSVDGPLTFLLNPGPGLVEPSVTNPSDPNFNTNFGFCEFTFNSAQIYANISYVDFVSLPISLTLTNTSGATQHVSGMPANGLQTVCDALQAQSSQDGAGWNQLIQTSNGQNLRALSPNNGIVLNNNLFNGYFQSYVDQVYAMYSGQPLSVDTQGQWGIVQGTVSNGTLNFAGNGGSFGKPSAADIFSCSTGPFVFGSNIEMGAITARLSAAFNRSTLLTDSLQPNTNNDYYQNWITNHYSRIVHSVNLDHRGYAFPYDDVAANGGPDQSGSVFDGSPQLLTVAVGGANAHT